MLALKDNNLYHSTVESFKQSNFEESIQTVQGFILGVLAQGLTSSDNQILQLFTQLINNDTALSGKGIAVFTTMLLELERDLKQNKVNLFLYSADDKATTKERLQALQDVAYGAMLGLSVHANPKGLAIMASKTRTQALASQKKISPKLQDQLDTLSHITQVDVDSDEFSQQDYEFIATEIGAILVENYTFNHIHG